MSYSSRFNSPYGVSIYQKTKVSNSVVGMHSSSNRRESRRAGSAESFSRQKCKARTVYRTVVGGGGKSLLCDPRSELRLQIADK